MSASPAAIKGKTCPQNAAAVKSVGDKKLKAENRKFDH